jgi:hypothetical protein
VSVREGLALTVEHFRERRRDGASLAIEAGWA